MFHGDFHLAQCNLYKDPPLWNGHSWYGIPALLPELRV